ncbi:hypothetical protein Q7P37_007475 [Cladosporium fusiforme]
MATRFPISEGTQIVLHGLEGEFDVLSHRNAIINGTLKPFTNLKVMGSIKTVAITLHDQMRLNPDLRTRIRTGDSPIAWFLCAMHRIIPPRTSQTSFSGSESGNAPLEFLSSMPPWYKDRIPSSLDTEDEDKLPDLNDEDMLPLCYWEGLYYAAIAETSIFYRDTETRYEEQASKESFVLHHEGVDGCNKGPVTPLHLLKVLETCWDMLMNPLLTTTFDFAVRQHAAWLDKGDVPSVNEVMVKRGLINVNSMSWGHIMRVLSERCVQNVKIAVRSQVSGVPFMLDLKQIMDYYYIERQDTPEQIKEAETSTEANDTPKRKPVPAAHRSSAGQSPLSIGISPALRDAPVSSRPSMQFFTSPETLQTGSHLRESLQGLHSHPASRNSATSSRGATQRFPSFDNSRPLPSAPQQTQAEEYDTENTEDMPTLRRMQIRARPATSPSTTPPPERMGAARSKTAPSGSAPFSITEPVPFGPRNSPLEPIPRTSSEQRYVSAGGHRPLHEREVMNDYFLPAVDSEGTKTYSAKKEELWAQIDSKEQTEQIARAEKARELEESRESAREKGILKRMFSRSQSEGQ